MTKTLVVLVLAATLAAFTAVIFSLDAVSTARDEKQATPATTTPAAAEGTHASGALTSFAGAKPVNADELAKAHEPYSAELPAVPAGDVVEVKMVLKDVTVEIAPGVKYTAWGFEGGVPGPIVHVREGQTVRMTLVNGGAIPHSIDFHAARIAPDVAFRDVAPGESLSYEFVAGDPGVYMYHCGTKPVLAHIANGMYGAIVVSPAKPLPKADKEYVLVGSEFYLDGDGLAEPAAYDVAKAHAQLPDWVTFNGYAGQYATHPLTAEPNDLVRFYVVAAGPSLDVDFHVVGTIFDKVYPFQDMNPAHALEGVQTFPVPAGGGAVFEMRIPDPGIYPFVSHSFASVDLGMVGLLKVGEPTGSATH
ncbi:MAG: multicopper oxidase domain-containing protein [Gaiellaceae bacterium]